MLEPSRRPLYLLTIHEEGGILHATGLFATPEALEQRPAIAHLIRRQLRDMERRIRADRRRALGLALLSGADTPPHTFPLRWDSRNWPDS